MSDYLSYICIMKPEDVRYPDVALEYNNVRFAIYTTLRKKGPKGYYLWNFMKYYDIDLSNNRESFEQQKRLALAQMHKEVYINLILGIVDESCIDGFGMSVFKLDPNQQSEEERLKNLIKI